MAVTLKIAIDERYPKKDGECPIRLTITYQRKAVPYTTIFSMTTQDYLKLRAPNINGQLKEIRNVIKEIEEKAHAVLKQLDPFCHEKFRLNYILNNPLFLQTKQKKAEEITVQQNPFEFDFKPYEKKFMILREKNLTEKGKIGYTYLKIVKQLIEEKRIGTALKYNDSFSSIYKKAGNLSFTEIDIRFLKSFENWMVDKNGCSRAWVGSILRHLRGVFKNAIEEGFLIKSPENYPFGKRRYKIPSVKKQKTAITPENMAVFYEYIPTCPSEEKAKDFWFFQYFGNGMNPKDMCHLKWSNYNGQYISFIRAKSELTAETTVAITVFVTDDLKRIIEKWGNPDKSPESYIFPILQPGMNELEQTLKVKRTADFIREWTNKISEKLGILAISNKHSRIQFASDLKYANVDKEYIKDALGHTDTKTTDAYLGAFNLEVVKVNSTALGRFKKMSR